MSRRVLLTGASGLLGPYLADGLCELGQVIGLSRRASSRGRMVTCDLTDGDSVREMLTALAPDIVVHAAALTSVDECEENPDEARRQNALTSQHIAEHLPAECQLCYISTDQVYPDSPGPHAEGQAAPLTVYGRTKLDGEGPVLARKNGLVLRVNLFGPSRTQGRQSLSDLFAARLGAGEETTLFSDALFSPLHMRTLTNVAMHCLGLGLAGVYNLGSRDGMSKADFALALCEHLGISTESATICESREIPGRTIRALDLRMDVTKLEAGLGDPMPTLLEEVAKL